MPRLDSRERHDLLGDLQKVANEFLEAGRRYREFLKQHYPDRLAGVVYVRNEDGEMALYSENERYTQAIKATHIPE